MLWWSEYINWPIRPCLTYFSGSQGQNVKIAFSCNCSGINCNSCDLVCTDLLMNHHPRRRTRLHLPIYMARWLLVKKKCSAHSSWCVLGVHAQQHGQETRHNHESCVKVNYRQHTCYARLARQHIAANKLTVWLGNSGEVPHWRLGSEKLYGQYVWTACFLAVEFYTSSVNYCVKVQCLEFYMYVFYYCIEMTVQMK